MLFNSPFFKALLLAVLLSTGLWSVAQSSKAEDKLTTEILRMDSILFTAFNAKNLEVVKNVFSKNLEFYHDKGGLSNYETNMENTKSLFARVPDLTRQLVPGSTEVYPIKDYGAVQTGAHRFCHKEAGKDDCGIFKFMHIWQKTAEGWKLSRVVSYNH